MPNLPQTGALMQVDWTPTAPSAALVTLSTYGRDFNTDEEADTYDTTTYAEASVTPLPKRTYIAGLGDGSATMDVLYQTGDVATYNKLAPGTTGTLAIRREGTGTGKPLETYAGAIITKRGKPSPYDDLVVMSMEWQLSGVPTVTVQA